jgi:hypothetical protein
MRNQRSKLLQLCSPSGCDRNGLVLQLLLTVLFLAALPGAAAQCPPKKKVLIVTQVGLFHRIYALVETCTTAMDKTESATAEDGGKALTVCVYC